MQVWKENLTEVGYHRDVGVATAQGGMEHKHISGTQPARPADSPFYGSRLQIGAIRGKSMQELSWRLAPPNGCAPGNCHARLLCGFVFARVAGTLDELFVHRQSRGQSRFSWRGNRERASLPAPSPSQTKGINSRYQI